MTDAEESGSSGDSSGGGWADGDSTGDGSTGSSSTDGGAAGGTPAGDANDDVAPSVTDPSYDEWRAALDDGTLLGQRCPDCGHETAAPKAACAQCGSPDVDRIELPTEGEVFARTRIEIAPAEFEGPYDIGLVTVGEARVLARLGSHGGGARANSSASGGSSAGAGSSDRRSDGGEFEIGDAVSFQGVYEGERGPAPVFG